MDLKIAAGFFRATDSQDASISNRSVCLKPEVHLLCHCSQHTLQLFPINLTIYPGGDNDKIKKRSYPNVLYRHDESVCCLTLHFISLFASNPDCHDAEIMKDSQVVLERV